MSRWYGQGPERSGQPGALLGRWKIGHGLSQSVSQLVRVCRSQRVGIDRPGRIGGQSPDQSLQRAVNHRSSSGTLLQWTGDSHAPDPG